MLLSFNGPPMTMTTAEAPNAPKNDVYDPEDVGLRDSPPLRIIRPKLAPTPSPPPEGLESESEDSTTPGCHKSRKLQKRRSKTDATPGDAVLINALAGGKAPEVARQAGQELLPSASDDEDMDSTSGHGGVEMTVDRLEQSNDLAALAAGALEAFNNGDIAPIKPEPVAEVVESTVDGPRHLSPQRPNINGNHELAPIQVSSPKAEKANGLTLPSITDQLGDLKHLADAATATVDKGTANGVHRPSFSSQSPPQPPLFQGRDSVHHQPLGHGHASPPISPHENFSRELPSPGRVASQFYYPNPRRPSQASEGPPYSSAADYTSSIAETPSTDQSGSTPGGIPSGIDRMSIDGITNPLVGGFQCGYQGCTAQPFQTQYLLNSHANVHSSNRPHYCPVKGCPRSEGGKGFKRKNEMIRHGLVHESPGYVCPYCVDREHKYPRPDNLQRFVIFGMRVSSLTMTIY